MGQSFRIDAAAVADGEVVHGECHDGGQPELHHHRQQVQRSGQRGGVQHHDGKVGNGHARRAGQRVDGNLLVGTHRRQRICAGGVHELPVLRVSRCFRFFVMVLPAGDGHRGAGRVHRAGSRAEQRVEHGRFANVRIAYKHDAFYIFDVSHIAGVAAHAVIRGSVDTTSAMPASHSANGSSRRPSGSVDSTFAHIPVLFALRNVVLRMFIPREPYPDGTRGAAVHRDTFVSECDDPSAESAPLHDP